MVGAELRLTADPFCPQCSVFSEKHSSMISKMSVGSKMSMIGKRGSFHLNAGASMASMGGHLSPGIPLTNSALPSSPGGQRPLWPQALPDIDTEIGTAAVAAITDENTGRVQGGHGRGVSGTVIPREVRFSDSLPSASQDMTTSEAGALCSTSGATDDGEALVAGGGQSEGNLQQTMPRPLRQGGAAKSRLSSSVTLGQPLAPNLRPVTDSQEGSTSAPLPLLGDVPGTVSYSVDASSMSVNPRSNKVDVLPGQGLPNLSTSPTMAFKNWLCMGDQRRPNVTQEENSRRGSNVAGQGGWGQSYQSYVDTSRGGTEMISLVLNDGLVSGSGAIRPNPTELYRQQPGGLASERRHGLGGVLSRLVRASRRQCLSCLRLALNEDSLHPSLEYGVDAVSERDRGCALTTECLDMIYFGFPHVLHAIRVTILSIICTLLMSYRSMIRTRLPSAQS